MRSCSFFRLFVQVAFLGSTVVVVAFAPSLLRSTERPSRHYNDNTVLDATKRKGAADRKKGFGKETTTTTATTTTTTKNPVTGRSIYSLPALYDLAFGYRNYQDEVDFLFQAHEMCTAAAPQRVLELAAGPARHSLMALTRNNNDDDDDDDDATTTTTTTAAAAPPVQSVTAVDVSPEMVQYATTTLAEELLSDNQRQRFTYVCQDMRTFTTTATFDTAWILLGSLQHLQTNDHVISCFQSVWKCLTPGGTLILELPHPRETFSMVECTKNKWEVPLEDEEGKEYGELKIVWGDETDVFDPIQQVRQFTVSFELVAGTTTTTTMTNNNELSSQDLQSVKQVIPMRLFTAQEIDALARCSGFEVAFMFGALSYEVDVNDNDEAFRLVCVLRKTQ